MVAKKKPLLKLNPSVFSTNAEPKFFDFDPDYIRENHTRILIDTLNWYSYHSNKDKNEQWMLKHYPKLRGNYNPNLGFLCRMVEMGYPKDLLQDRIDMEVEKGMEYVANRKSELKEKQDEKQKLVHPDNKNLFGKVIDKVVDNVCAEIDYVVDAVLENRKPAYPVIDKMMSRIRMNQVSAYLKKQLDEFTDVYKDKDYGITKKKESEIIRALKIIQKDIEAGQMVQNKIKSKSVPTKRRKPIDESKIVKDFLVVDTKDYASINPVKMLSAKYAFVFDGDSRRLSLFVANIGGTLKIKGKSIIDYDPETSSSKILRKPEVQIKSIMEQGTRAKMVKYYTEEIKTTPTSPRVRSGNKTTILKCYTN